MSTPFGTTRMRARMLLGSCAAVRAASHALTQTMRSALPKTRRASNREYVRISSLWMKMAVR
ncbi:hypothetical protein GCM10025870_19780 [Agromyces marinus]|uniref:Secreted protein n=1 Tax=Agromyces marinus TaxID=1389020 RepID=A0ABN6YG41_9MICO|nr:hypothetical protein GCM10025870_19780 [Agromyces marinus]